MTREPQSFPKLLATMKKGAGALEAAGVPFMLGGGLACWARGGPRTEHDVDFLVRPRDAEAALDALVLAGMRPQHPPENWLLKAYDDDVLVDLIFEPSGFTVDDRTFDRSEVLEVHAVRMRVAALEDVMATKLLALSEQFLDYLAVLGLARALREQIHWDEVRVRTERSPYARAFIYLIEELGIAERDRAAA